MCGIVGIVSQKDVVPRLIEGLKRLEYRGYDSAGIAIIGDGILKRCRAQGKIAALERELKHKPLMGVIGIGHTRWATHGIPNLPNAHPHMSEKVAVVHNGIIENYKELKHFLEKKGYKFESETDTEVVVHLTEYYLNEGLSPEDAAPKVFAELRGAYALALIFAPLAQVDRTPLMIGARQGSPLAIGYGKDEMFLGSDAMALSPFSHQISYLEEGDWVVITPNKVQIFTKKNEPVNRPIQTLQSSEVQASKGAFPHFMLKEIFDQPGVLAQVLKKYVPTYDVEKLTDIKLLEGLNLKKIEEVTIVACGTSYYAAAVAKNWLEHMAQVRVQIDIASEFRYREPPLHKKGVSIFISQSGETADTLAAMRYAKNQGQTIIALVNVAESSLGRESDFVYPLYAGPEIGVASTKAFTCQLMILALMSIKWAWARKVVSKKMVGDNIHALRSVPGIIGEILDDIKSYEKFAEKFSGATSCLYLGRGALLPIAFEGALKLKELSYIHAEGFAGGELKHGPIALVDEKTPVIYLLPGDRLLEKNISNVEEILARKGRVILLLDSKSDISKNTKGIGKIILTLTTELTAPLIYSVPLQLLAYYAAVKKGTDVDQPRNLAKSVTVE